MFDARSDHIEERHSGNNEHEESEGEDSDPSHNSRQYDDTRSHESFGRDHPHNRLDVSNQDQDIVDFRKAMDLKYLSIKRILIKKYKDIRLEYLKHMDYAIRENERENSSAIDYMEQLVEEASNERDTAVRRATQSKVILANIFRTQYHLKHSCFESWKYYYDWKKYVDAKSKFCDNYYKNKTLRKMFNGLRRVTHEEFIEKAFNIRDAYEVQQRRKIYDVDSRSDNLMLYLSQLQQQIEDETGLILEIPDDYQIGTGLERIKNETEKLRNTEVFDEVRMTQTEAVFQN
jgi:hypothetical protein